MGGQLLYLSGMVDKRTMEKYEREAKEAGRESWYLSWALDSTPQERAKGKTVEGARNDIFAVRPAPVIISLMGFAGTMASGWSDYILADLHACSPLGSALERWRMRRGGGETSRMQDHFETLWLEHDFDIEPDPESTSEDWMFSEKLM
ncbi:unnamed protein product [Rhizoctonia solani]|uniref:O-GlcNAc transferase C-terminal domain-containing protein n=1 Tax=Rhizoctonia solani TaxID=456999 RepID=A0A8H3BCK3_9AGAM|nr:unnamed protein product [Rhizoctonia solani]